MCFLSSALRASRLAGSMSYKGALRGPAFMPIRLQAVFTGIGFVSIKRVLASLSVSRNILRLPSISPLELVAHLAYFLRHNVGKNGDYAFSAYGEDRKRLVVVSGVDVDVVAAHFGDFCYL